MATIHRHVALFGEGACFKDQQAIYVLIIDQYAGNAKGHIFNA